jgi:hypothetical protein
METYLKKYFWIYYLALIGLLAYSTAGLVTFFVERQLKAFLSVSQSASRSSVHSQYSASRESKWATPISKRNLFNSTPPEDDPEGTNISGEAEPEQPTGGFPAPYDPCEDSKVNAQLKVTWIAEPSSDSKAVFNVDNKTRILAEGDELDESILVAIQWRGDGGRVVFQKKWSIFVLKFR